MNKKFSTLLLTGKAASLPFLMQEAQAVTPSYTDILTTELTQIQVPVANSVRLDALGSSTYGGSATLCSDTTVANKMSLVLTGLKDQDSVFVLTSTTTGGNELFHASIKVGLQNIAVPVATTVTGPASGAMALTVPLDLSALQQRGYSLSQGGKFYMQTVVFPAGSWNGSSYDWSRARVSELDTVVVNKCNSTHGSNPYGGSSY